MATPSHKSPLTGHSVEHLHDLEAVVQQCLGAHGLPPALNTIALDQLHQVGHYCFHVRLQRQVTGASSRWPPQDTGVQKAQHSCCIGRESNPGLPRGRREFYH